MNINVGIIEDERQIRESLAILIDGSEGFSCTHTFADAESAIAMIPDLLLDVVLTDIYLPQKSGIECIALLKPICTKVQFLICTSFDDPESVFAALKAGASGYLTKTTPPARILDAISETYLGGSPMSSNIARMVVASFQQPVDNAALKKLSDREKEILHLLSQGLRYKEIALHLFLSTETVRTHIRNIYEKLQVNSRTDALNKTYPK